MQVGKKTSTDSEDNAWKPYFGHFKEPVWPLKYMSDQGHQNLI